MHGHNWWTRACLDISFTPHPPIKVLCKNTQPAKAIVPVIPKFLSFYYYLQIQSFYTNHMVGVAKIYEDALCTIF
jgi:hypothetical protein